jgi:hemerythrin
LRNYNGANEEVNMTALPWKDEYNVNVAVMDTQHRRLAELVGNLHTAIQTKQTGKELREVLGELIAFTRLHFATEEELMLTYEYPDYPAHLAEHKLVLSQMSDLATSFGDEAAVSFDADADIAEDWVYKHLLERDAPLGKFLNGKGVY